MSEPIKRVRGNKEYRAFQAGAVLTRKQAMLAMCYDCLGGEGLHEDCCGTMCPLYQYYPVKNAGKTPRAFGGQG